MSANTQARISEWVTSSAFWEGARLTLGDNRSEIWAGVGYRGCRSGSTVRSTVPIEEDAIRAEGVVVNV